MQQKSVFLLHEKGAEMDGNRTVLCPFYGHTNTGRAVCRRCDQPIELDPNDFHNAVLLGVDDGHHSWYSPPTSIHERYRCKSHPARCASCMHDVGSDTFCRDGKIDIRRRRRQCSNGEVVYIYKDWIEK